MKRVLIVEDDLVTMYALRSFFIRQWWDVDATRTLAGAMDSLDPPPDWIILDLRLIDGNGESVLRKVREEGLAIRVAIITASLYPELIERLMPLRPDLVMSKPIDFQRLLLAIDSLAEPAGAAG